MLKPCFVTMLPMIQPDRHKGHPGGADESRRLTGRFLLESTIWTLLFCCFWCRVHGDLAADAKGLTVFKQAVDQRNILEWSNTSDVCIWSGIECTNVSTPLSLRVTKIRLPKAGLSGPIPTGSLSQLTELRVLSARTNRLSGNLPADLSKCRFIRSVYLQDNVLVGPLPDFSSWPNLVHFDVSLNNFSGDIPASVAELTQLKSLYLQNNSLTGSLPALNMSSLINFNVSNNLFTGSIPSTDTYKKFDQSAFLGNRLCGFPLEACAPVPAPPTLPIAIPPPSNKKSKKSLSGGAIAGIVIGSVGFLLLVCLLCCLAYKRTKSRGTAKQDNLYAGRSVEGSASVEGVAAPKGEAAFAAAAAAMSSEPDRNRLIFFEGNKFGFDLEDLLRASAEVLGKGSVGTSYKAVLESGAIVAVKRLKDVNIENKEFDQKMQFFGKLKHENLVPVIAYYYSRGEKLLVSNYMTNGSLSALLHGNKEANSTPLDWDTRVRIALGAALGIRHLHEQDSMHGNIKSSNVLLTSNYTGCVSDYGLTPLVGTMSAANRMVGYRAPEMTDIRKQTPKMDVYSYGVLLLELLTGKPPSHSSMGEEGRDLPVWVQSVPREEEGWFQKVFDPQLTRFEGVEEEMERVLTVALECVKPSPDQRPTMMEVVEKLENFK